MAFYHEMLNAFLEIAKAPFKDLSALWMLIPLFLIWFVLEVYFGFHKKEQLGWNTSLGNGIAIFWITVELMRHLFKANFEYFALGKFFIVLLLLVYAIFICYISFKHVFNSKTTYAISSPSVVYYFSGIVILWAYGSLEITWWVFLDILLLFGIILGLGKLLRKFIPDVENEGKIIGKENLDVEASPPPSNLSSINENKGNVF